jgi:hypothetical protein
MPMEFPATWLRKELFPDLLGVRHSRMLLSLDFPRDGEVLEPSGIQARAGTGPPIKTSGGDALGINSHGCVLIPRQLAAG